MPDPELVHIVFALDRSGSMEPLRRSTVAGFNAFLARQREAGGRRVVTLVQFSDEVWTTWEALPLGEACLELHDYWPGGNTALHDAVGSTIDKVGQGLAALPDEQRPGKVLFAILTDGEENCSRCFDAEAVRRRICTQVETYAWEFLFLGASSSWLEQARELGIGSEEALTFVASPEGMEFAMNEVSERFAERGGE